MFEKFEYNCSAESGLIVNKCLMKHISRRQLKIDIQLNFTKPVHKAYLHTQVYFRYMTYQKFPISLWDDMCGWFVGKRRSFIMDWTLGKMLKYSNLNHSCPYFGHIFVKVDNISMDSFVFEQLIPAGRFRIDFNLTDEYRSKTPMFMGKLFASVSDNRIEQF